MRRGLSATVFIAAIAGASMSAHHSYAAYDRAQIIEIDGILEQIEWADPHTLLKVRADSKLYTAEWQAANSLKRRGLTRDTLKAGDRVIVTGHPRRDIADSGVVNLKTVRRLTDGWSWPQTAGTLVTSGSNR